MPNRHPPTRCSANKKRKRCMGSSNTIKTYNNNTIQKTAIISCFFVRNFWYASLKSFWLNRSIFPRNQLTDFLSQKFNNIPFLTVQTNSKNLYKNVAFATKNDKKVIYNDKKYKRRNNHESYKKRWKSSRL